MNKQTFYILIFGMFTLNSSLFSMMPFASPVKPRQESYTERWPEYHKIAAEVDAQLANLPEEERAKLNRQTLIHKRLADYRTNELKNDPKFQEPGILPRTRKRQIDLYPLFKEQAEKRKPFAQ